MEVGELQSTQNLDSQDQASWIPATPAKPNLAGQKVNHEPPPAAPPAAAAAAGGSREFNNWRSENNVGQLRSMSFQELLLIAEAGAMSFAVPVPKGSDGPAGGPVLCAEKEWVEVDVGESSSATRRPENRGNSLGTSSYSEDNFLIHPHHSFDLNLTPGATFDPLLRKSIPSFAPVTPDKSLRVYDKEDSEVQILDVDDVEDRVRENQKNKITANMVNINELSSVTEVPRRAEDSLAAADGAAVQEIQNPDNGTPQQKQRRKKHRPKVVIEGKPRTPKPVTPKPADSNKNSTGKRKYVRKNKAEKASETPPEVAKQCSDSKMLTPRKKSCRRALDFKEMQPKADDSRYCSSNVSSEPQVRHYCTRRALSKSTIQLCSALESVTVGSTVHESCPTHEMGESCMLEGETIIVRTSVPVKTNSPLKEMNARIQGDNKDVQVTAHNRHGNSAQVLLERDTSIHPMSPNDFDCSSSVDLTEGKEQAKENKSNYHCAVRQADTGNRSLSGAHYNCLHTYLIPWSHNKRKRSDKGQGQNNTFYPRNDTKDNPYGSKISNLMSPQPNHNKVLDNLQTHTECFIKALSPNETPTKKRSRSATRARDLASLTMFAGYSMGGGTYPTTLPVLYKNGQRVENFQRPDSCIHALNAQTGAKVARKRRSKMRSTLAVHNLAFQHDQRFYSMLSGAPRDIVWTEMLSVDAIDKQLHHLDINGENIICEYQERNSIVPFTTRYREHNALVLYNRDGTVVPFKGSFDPSKKLRPRPKVDLDEETNRVWKLLLEDINSEGIDGTDEDKAKWWEEERKVFRGRADSFIARMHLVQGDRRFSQWKGSVLDSVVGVFLTQNVSDHLSSSAFMSLAARFPLKLRNHNKACVVSAEPQVCLTENTSNQPVCGWTSLAPHDLEHIEITGVERNGTGTDDCNSTRCYMEQDEKANSLIYLQQSIDSSKSGSCSESNSDAEGLPNRSKHESLDDSSSSLEGQQKEESSMLHEVYLGIQEMLSDKKLQDDCNKAKATEHDDSTQNMYEVDAKSSSGSSKDPASSPCLHETTNAELSILESFEIFLRKTQSSDTSQNKTENSASDQSTLTMESANETSIQQNMTVILQEATRSSEPANNIRAEKNVLIESQSSFVENPKVAGALTEETQEVMKKTAEADLNECGHSLTKEWSELDAGKEKKDNWDWDNLRKQAEAKGRRERTEKTVDSLDWEAVRCADVSEISYTIRERGMNNKLAERIKKFTQDFLNRLVRDHGSTDLEWLRDVPPDQAKEYLLSIRGLGLKSVECVRLLTLHHLAFPVDTNVGRIAVRLGWVPLQPLPESLQLHLLELYPVLESIQKYLWPRLCRLDQRTLYELHYQMITFGKVFCTKSKPNCNACPMRGECRHFASAFASARLSLPGPEEKSVVIATDNRKEDIKFTVINERTPLPLPHATEQSEDNRLLEGSDQSGEKAGASCCEPIIEEPATPEPECTTILEDFEDTFYEDPDEIPMIKLNIEEFTQNLQNYMQENMELQEGDMSKALVALSPEAASIPMPKLKNVSRLRTEHQVYELPDSHPLLEKLQLEKREPDDPSSYLLAIWTPGETANSFEPPERRCSSQVFGKLCNEKECFSCNSVREANSQTVRGTLLIPCRTAMRGSFPLNGTYFQVNELFADHDSSLKPIDVPRTWIWNLQRRTVYFGTSIPTIFKGLTTQGIQQCFWRGYVCVRGFDRKTRAPRPLMARLHFPASKVKRTKDVKNE
ncbi:DNA-3-methyladenine glycosylase I [Parasponia andersonii]|uniref:DNA-3-methyladenine glycosylase I n=1 Tax=Parasponia andersonii TaxID=3476 RepID=A0A2P5C508_PARAD|nr:DNA-3-methyladenine glycosylase I [Parasponia andersonii]